MPSALTTNPDQHFLNFNVHTNHLVILLKFRFPGSGIGPEDLHSLLAFRSPYAVGVPIRLWRVHPFAGLNSWTSSPSSLFSDCPTSQPLWGWQPYLCSRWPGPVRSPWRQRLQLRLPAWLHWQRAPVHRWVPAGQPQWQWKVTLDTHPHIGRTWFRKDLSLWLIQLWNCKKRKRRVSFESKSGAKGGSPLAWIGEHVWFPWWRCALNARSHCWLITFCSLEPCVGGRDFGTVI